MDDIAIIGFSFKLPQDVDSDSIFWDVLQNRRNLMTDWPESRINAASFDSDKNSKLYCRGGHFINEEPGTFDAPFFSVTAKEAAAMDPMQRWTLETSYRAFENAGISAESLKGSRTAVFSASMTDDYSRMVAMDPDNVPRTAATGTFASIIPNRVSWYFDLRGPSIHVDSACSSSLMAVDLACQTLRNGSASSALVTGSNMILGPTIFSLLSNLNFLSPDSVCYSFDHRANGYARGEGIIALVLKPLSGAIRDGDMIRAVIRATGSNQDGHTPGLTQPSPQAQEDLIRQVYNNANLPFDVTRYVEAHGTGTPVGDPIEMKGIGRVFRAYRSTKEPLYVGSVKANIGHLEGSSGLAGILKSIMILEKGIIPPNALFEKINPAIDVDFYHTEIPTENVAWPCEGLRRVSVNSFGFGGSNTHIILDDAFHYLQDQGLTGNHHTVPSTGTLGKCLPTSNGTPSVNGTAHLANGTVPNGVNGTMLLVLSARDEKALRRMVRAYETFYKDQVAGRPAKLDALAFTLADRRSHMLWRTFAVVNHGIESRDVGLSAVEPIRSSTEAGLAFVFTGQGAQYVDMGSELVQYPIFKATLQRVDEIYRSLGCKWSIFDELRNSKTIDRPEYSQPLSTAVQIALVELLKSFGVVPKAVVGHSSGEIAAAYTIGALSLLSACKVSYFRGQLAGKLRTTTTSPGAMMSVNLPEGQVQGYLESMNAAGVAASINIACINSPLNCTLSGLETAIDAVKKQLDRDGIFAHKLNTGVAYHSPSMSVIAADYLSQMKSIDSDNSQGIATSIPMVSSVTGQAVSPALLATAQYWVDNMVSPVRFADAVHILIQESSTLKVGMAKITDLVEIGPHCALRRPVQETLSRAGSHKKQIQYTSVLYRSKPAVQSMLECFGQLFCHGYVVSITAANRMSSSQGLLPFLVGCPEYPFDHSNKYWFESRLSRDFRLRGPAFGETLGLRFFDWNPLEPRWRNFLSIESTPWIADHNISDSVIYPAAGMLVMAMEAVQQMSPAKRQISGYYVKEAHFMSPIVVKAAWEDRTETILHLQPIRKPHEKESTWFDIKIFSYFDSRWSECFRAIIQIQYEESTPVDAGQERRLANEWVLGQYRCATKSCTRPIDSRVFYKEAAEHGLKYGDSFQLLEDIHWDDRANAIARVDVSKSTHQTASLVHPAVLDAAFHALRVSTTKGLSASSATNVPVRIIDAWFAPTGWQHPQTSSVRYLAISSAEAGRESDEGGIYALADDGSTLCTIRKAMTAVVSRSSANEGYPVAKKLLYGVEWKPQLSLLDPQQLARACDANAFVRNEATMLLHHQKLGYILDKVASRTLKHMSDADRQRVPDSLRRHVTWMEHHVKQLPPSRADDDISDTKVEALLVEIEALHPAWKLFTTVVRHLRSILTGETDPLGVIFDSNLANIFYADMFENICDHRLQKFLDLASHEKPNMRILEVGAGTGGMTSHILSALQELEKQSGGLKFSEYTYTDISPAFFESASKQWQDLKERMTFKTFNVERSPDAQGLEPFSYDLVIAGSVLHATEDLMATIRHVRRALKPGGRLVLLEVVAPEDVITNFTFGLVPGWWRSREEWRTLSPVIREQQWDECLKANGFTGNDLCLRDWQNDQCHIFSIIVTKAEEQLPETPSDSRLLLVVDKQSGYQIGLANLVRGHLVQLGDSQAEILSVDQFRKMSLTDDNVVVFLVETDKPFLATMSEADFQWLQDFIKRTQKLLWVTSKSMEDTQYAQYNGIAPGFLRTMRAEAPDKHIVTLAIESQGEPPETHAQYIAKAVRAAFDSPPSKELEYIVHEGQITSGRVVQDISLNDTLRSFLHPQLKNKPWLPGPALELSVDTPGTLDSLRFIEDATHQTEQLGAHEVEIEAKVWGLNFRELLVALARLENEELGIDCAGVVTKVGSSCNSAIQLGDRVGMVSLGCMRTYPRAHETAVIKIPDDLSFEAAASIIVPGMTAYYSLVDIARLRKGEKILIHSASGSTGQMAIWMAKMRGAEIFATVGFDEKKRFLMDRFGIPDDHIFYSRNTSFAQGIMRVTKGYGVDVVLNSLSGDGLRASWECIASYGRFIEIGKADIKSNASLPMASFARNVSFSAVDLRHIVQSDVELTSRLLKSTFGLLTDGTIQHPGPLHVYPVSDTEQAFRHLQSGQNIGRIVISINSSDVVPQLLRERRSWTFDENASYLIIGGAGGLGRAILKWMADRGAKHLIVPSRSGATSKAASEVILELTARGVKIVSPMCDASSATSFAGVLDDCARNMPPIKGCINAAMVLQDAVFENMTHAQWELTIRSKVQLSWNLHHLLPQSGSLDFFILLSSLNGVCGALAQSNYAGGCSFQDALARHRVACGQKAISIDIGWMRNIGIVAETGAYQRQRQNWDDMQQIDGAELLALLSVYCDAAQPLPSSPQMSQVLFGLRTPADFLALAQTAPALLDRPLFAAFSHVVGEAKPAGSSSTVDQAALFRQASDSNERIQIVIIALAAKLARVMSISPDGVEPSKSLSNYGVDSLMAVELRNWIRRDFKANVAVFDIMGGLSIAAIGDLVVAKSTIKNSQVLTNGAGKD